MTNKRYCVEIRGYTAEVIDRKTGRIVLNGDIPECYEAAGLLEKGKSVDAVIEEINRYLPEHCWISKGPAPVIDMPIDRYVIEPY